MALAPAIVDGLTGSRPDRPLVGPLHNATEIAGQVPRIVPARISPTGGWRGDAHIRTTHLGGLIDRDGLVIVPADATDGTPVEFLPLRG
jgi:molybdopterin molybdotransferase